MTGNLSHVLGGGAGPGQPVPGLPLTHDQLAVFAAAIGVRGQKARAIIQTIQDQPSLIGATSIEWNSQ